MQLIITTTFKRMFPKKGFLAAYIRFPWNQYKNLIGKDANIYQVSDSQFIIAIGNEFKPNDSSKSTEIGIDDSLNENNRFKLKNEGFKTLKTQNNDVRNWACGLVGYDVALTRRRSPVRIRSGPCCFFVFEVSNGRVLKNFPSKVRFIFFHQCLIEII